MDEQQSRDLAMALFTGQLKDMSYLSPDPEIQNSVMFQPEPQDIAEEAFFQPDDIMPWGALSKAGLLGLALAGIKPVARVAEYLPGAVKLAQKRVVEPIVGAADDAATIAISDMAREMADRAALDMSTEARMARAAEDYGPVLFHGTPAGDYAEFAKDKLDPTGLYGPGIYMTDSPEIAGGKFGYDQATKTYWPGHGPETGYANIGPMVDRLNMERGMSDEIKTIKKTIGELAPDDSRLPVMEKWLADAERDLLTLGPLENKPTIYPLRARVKNPFKPETMKIKKKEVGKDIIKALEYAAYSKGETLQKKWPLSWDRLEHYLGKVGAQDVLKKAGYDGIQHTGGLITGMPKHKVTIAFEPNQVRSIFAAFDPAKRDSSDLLAGVAPLLAPTALAAALSQFGTEDQ